MLTHEDIIASFVERFGPAMARAETSYGQSVVDLPPRLWTAAVEHARDVLGATFFDWLTAVDELDEGFSVVAHLWSVEQRTHVFLRTRVPRDAPVLDSITPVFPGAAWHERETAEMFGVLFEGFDDGTGLGLRPLLLPDGMDARPLRKDFVLAARVTKPWPGAKEPGESDADAGSPSRRKTLPPGVPDPTGWGPRPWTPEPEAPAEEPQEGQGRVRRRPGAPRRMRRQSEATPPS